MWAFGESQKRDLKNFLFVFQEMNSPVEDILKVTTDFPTLRRSTKEEFIEVSSTASIT